MAVFRPAAPPLLPTFTEMGTSGGATPEASEKGEIFPVCPFKPVPPGDTRGSTASRSPQRYSISLSGLARSLPRRSAFATLDKIVET